MTGGPWRVINLKTLYLCVDIEIEVGRFDRRLFKQGKANVTWRTFTGIISRDEVKPDQYKAGLCGSGVPD